VGQRKEGRWRVKGRVSMGRMRLSLGRRQPGTPMMMSDWPRLSLRLRLSRYRPLAPGHAPVRRDAI